MIVQWREDGNKRKNEHEITEGLKFSCRQWEFIFQPLSRYSAQLTRQSFQADVIVLVLEMRKQGLSEAEACSPCSPEPGSPVNGHSPRGVV